LLGAVEFTIAEALARRGLASVDADGDPLLARSVDSDGNVVEDPSVPDFAWHARHSWAWDPARLDLLIRTAAPATLYVCGGAANELELADRFTQVFLLELDEPAMLARLDAPSRDNEWGRIGDTHEHLRRRLPGHPGPLASIRGDRHRRKAARRSGGGRDTLLHVGQLCHEPPHQAEPSARSMTRHCFTEIRPLRSGRNRSA
jgi:hypothetical protein